jgi:hypothetical protein
LGDPERPRIYSCYVAALPRLSKIMRHAKETTEGMPSEKRRHQNDRKWSYCLKVFVISMVLMQANACSHVNHLQLPADSTVVGWVRLQIGDDQMDPRVRHVTLTTVGLWQAVGPLGSSGVGFLKTQWIELPKECRLVVSIPNEWAPSQAVELLQSFQNKGEQICAMSVYRE